MDMDYIAETDSDSEESNSGKSRDQSDVTICYPLCAVGQLMGGDT